jgi:hypothetical protein
LDCYLSFVFHLVVCAQISAHFTNGQEKVVVIPVTSEKNSRRGTLIHKLAARARIKELEGVGNHRDPKVKGETLYLGLRYGLVSQYTSFVAIAEQPLTDLQEGEKKTRQVVVATPQRVCTLLFPTPPRRRCVRLPTAK